jgi:hypothetical protein
MRRFAQSLLRTLAAAFVALPVAQGADAATLRVPADYSTVQAAIDAAVAGDTVEIASGTFVVTAPINPMGKAITIRGSVGATGELLTTLDGANAVRVIECTTGETLLTRFESLIVTRGLATNGAGMYADSSSPTVFRCRFLDNNAATTSIEALGGGAHVRYSNSRFTECEFIDNSAHATVQQAYGGALHASASEIEVSGCRFEQNRCESNAGTSTGYQYAYGGAISLADETEAAVTDSSFEGNIATAYSGFGGAISWSGTSTGAAQNCVFYGNSGTAGGAVAARGGTILAPTLSGCIGCDNTLNQIHGYFDGLTENCFARDCFDGDADGLPDACEPTKPRELHVPAEYPTILAALQQARDGDSVIVAAGEYVESLSFDVDGASVRIIGAASPSGEPATIVRPPSGTTLVFKAVAGDVVQIERIALSGGRVSLNGCQLVASDAVFEDATNGCVELNRDFVESTLSCTRCTFRDNTRTSGGGAVQFGYRGGTAEFFDCAFINNIVPTPNASENYPGGAIQIRDDCFVTAINCVFTGNRAKLGSAVAIDGSGNAYLEGCTFDSNFASTNGGFGAIASFDFDADGDASLVNCAFRGNSRGDVFLQDSHLSFEGCTFREAIDGCAYLRECSPSFLNCTFEQNQATNFPIVTAGVTSGLATRTPSFVQCVFRENTSAGAIFWNGGSTRSDLVACVFENNTVSSPSPWGSAIGNSASSPWLDRPRLTDCTICNHAYPLTTSYWTDGGGNCLVANCSDDDADGVPDQCGQFEDGIHHVPTEFSTIAAAVLAAGNGDTVVVAAGEHPVAAPISLAGKRLRIVGSTDSAGLPTSVLTGGGASRILDAISGESATTSFENLVFKQSSGRAVTLLGSSPRFLNCHFTQNPSGAVTSTDGTPAFISCRFSLNTAATGAGFYGLRAPATFDGCVFEENTATGTSGGAALFVTSNPVSTWTLLTNCVVRGNAGGTNGAIRAAGTVRIGQSTICGNTATQISGSFTDLGGNCISASCTDCFDSDLDGLVDSADNCPLIPNPTQQDCDGDGTGDACEDIPDCNANGVPDNCDLAGGAASDCNGNGVPDPCDVASGFARDCDGDGTLDSCEIAAGSVQDCNANGVPDPCEDDSVDRVTPNLGALSGLAPRTFVFEDLPLASTSVTVTVRAIGDLGAPTEFASLRLGSTTVASALFATTGRDCPESADIATLVIQREAWNGIIAPLGVPADLTVTLTASPLVDAAQCASPWTTVSISYGGPGYDCNGNGIKDICETVGGANDCDGNGRPDSCDVSNGSVPDCNANGIPDSCDLAAGAEDDKDGDGRPDSCEYAAGDFDLDGVVGAPDLSFLLILWGTSNPPVGDLDGDGIVGAQDLAALLLRWGPLP